QLVAVRLRPPGRGSPLGGEQVLGTIGNAMQRAPVPPRPELPVPLPGLCHRGLAQHRDHRVVGRAEALEPAEEVLGEFHGGYLPPAEQTPQLGDGLEREIAHARDPEGAEKTKSGSSPFASSTLRISSARVRPVLICRVMVFISWGPRRSPYCTRTASVRAAASASRSSPACSTARSHQ